MASPGWLMLMASTHTNILTPSMLRAVTHTSPTAPDAHSRDTASGLERKSHLLLPPNYGALPLAERSALSQRPGIAPPNRIKEGATASQQPLERALHRSTDRPTWTVLRATKLFRGYSSGNTVLAREFIRTSTVKQDRSTCLDSAQKEQYTGISPKIQ